MVMTPSGAGRIFLIRRHLDEHPDRVQRAGRKGRVRNRQRGECDTENYVNTTAEVRRVRPAASAR